MPALLHPCLEPGRDRLVHPRALRCREHAEAEHRRRVRANSYLRRGLPVPEGPIERHPRQGRSRTLSPRALTDAEIAEGRTLAIDEPRPRTRADCPDGPCPWVGCRHHLYLDVDEEKGSIKVNFPGTDPIDLKETCSLDVADRGGITLEETGELLNVTRERTRQIEEYALGLVKLAIRQ